MATAITNTNKPADTLRERGGLKATLWRHTTHQGRIYYDVLFVRTYRDDAGLVDSHYFREGDLLTLARLAERAHDRIRELRAQGAAETADVEADTADLGGAA